MTTTLSIFSFFVFRHIYIAIHFNIDTEYHYPHFISKIYQSGRIKLNTYLFGIICTVIDWMPSVFDIICRNDMLYRKKKLLKILKQVLCHCQTTIIFTIIHFWYTFMFIEKLYGNHFEISHYSLSFLYPDWLIFVIE